MLINYNLKKQMKFKLIIFSLFLIGNSSFSQEEIKIAKIKNLSQFEKSKELGTYDFQFPENTSKETVMKNAAYYKDYFSVNYHEKNKTATLKLLEINETNKKVIKRFLHANGIKQIEIEAKSLSIDEFFTMYILPNEH
jgi:DNA/RNA endonuclease G (NUC1)